MPKTEPLPERRDLFYFEHQPSEINYGGKMRFKQVAFPPPADKNIPDFETLIHRVIHRYTQIIMDKSPLAAAEMLSEQKERMENDTPNGSQRKGVFLQGQKEFLDIYFDQLVTTPFLHLKRYQHWVNHELQDFMHAYRQLRLNAIYQEKLTEIPRLNYFVVVAASTLIAEMVSEYFEKQIDQLGKIAGMVRLSLGRAFAWIINKVESDDEIARNRMDKLNHAQAEEAVFRLGNPFLLSFNNLSDEGMLDECTSGPNPYQVSHFLLKQFHQLFHDTLHKTRYFSATDQAAAFAEPRVWMKIVERRPIRHFMVKYLRRNDEMLKRLVLENMRCELRTRLREWVFTYPNPKEAIPYITNERQQEEILTKIPMQKKFLKMLRTQRTPMSAALKEIIYVGARLVRKSGNRWWGRLSRGALWVELESGIKRMSKLAAEVRDFHIVRKRYGRDSNQSISWQGIKIWRTQELVIDQFFGSQELLQGVWEKYQAEVMNHFEEGNMFLCRGQGEIYPHDTQRRNQVVFLFADLRNSTETTMKLNKDTASYLTPYLSAVNTSAIRNQGTRIYFAGDGYAAYYSQAVMAIRAAFVITEQFHRLQKVSGEEQVREAKEIYQHAINWEADLTRPKKMKQKLAESEDQAMPEKVRRFLTELSQLKEDSISEEMLKKVLARVTAIYSMPRIDVGVALTNGELFYAIVSEEKAGGTDKIPIVISPQLTQAARLSGSSDAVKKHIDTHLPQPFPYNVFTWEQKLYNRGIVITEMLFQQIQDETEVKQLYTDQDPFKNDRLYYYIDQELKRRIIIRENQEPVLLKGIVEPCKVYEVAVMLSPLDKAFGSVQNP